MQNILSLVTDKSNDVSPEAPDLATLTEETLTRSLISFPHCLDEHGITSDYFYHKGFRQIVQMVLEQGALNAPISSDLLKIIYKEKFLDADFAQFFDEQWKCRNSMLGNSIEYYAERLKEFHFKHSFDKIKASPTPGSNTNEKLNNLINRAKELQIQNVEIAQPTFDDDWLQVLELAKNAKDGILPRALRTHYKSLDLLIGEGILDDYLVVLGADSGAGKTTFALNLIKNIAVNDGHSTLYLSFEMGRVRLMRWFMACCMNIPFASLMDGTIPDDTLNNVPTSMASLCKDALVISEVHPELNTVVAAIRLQIAKNPNIRMIVIDHLHRMLISKSVNSTETITAITGGLKNLAMELQVPIVLLSQLKKPEVPMGGRSERRDPHVSDLKGSGSIVSDSDLIIMLQLDPSSNVGDQVRFVRAYVMKNRGGRADGVWVALGHQADRCVMFCN